MPLSPPPPPLRALHRPPLSSTCCPPSLLLCLTPPHPPTPPTRRYLGQLVDDSAEAEQHVRKGIAILRSYMQQQVGLRRASLFAILCSYMGSRWSGFAGDCRRRARDNQGGSAAAPGCPSGVAWLSQVRMPCHLHLPLAACVRACARRRAFFSAADAPFPSGRRALEAGSRWAPHNDIREL